MTRLTIFRTFICLVASVPVLLFSGIAHAACTVGSPDQVITGFRNSDLFVPSGQVFLVDGANINGSIIVGSGARLTVTDSIVNGSVNANEGDSVYICIEDNAFIDGNISVEKSNALTALIIDGSATMVEVKGGVELDKDDSANCGGLLRVVLALLRSDVQATGACELNVTHTNLEGDSQATDTALVHFENNTTTSDVAADFGNAVYIRDNPAIGGDLEFVGFNTVRVERNTEVNGGITLADNKNAYIVENAFDGDIEVDADPNKVSDAVVKVLRNTLTGSLSVDSGELAIAIARVKKNVLNGNLTVTGAADVKVIRNTVSNGNLSVEDYVNCVVRNNQVPGGNNLGCVAP